MKSIDEKENRTDPARKDISILPHYASDEGLRGIRYVTGKIMQLSE